MLQIKENLHKCLNALPKGVELVAVSKFHPADAIRVAYEEGHRIFGESRATELVAKAKELPKDISWHFIGHLQTNKVRMILPHVSLIHSVDSERLMQSINNEAQRINRIADVLLQVHVAQEETKFGFAPDELISLVASGSLNKLEHIRVRGIMGMASNTDDTMRIENDFEAIAQTFRALKSLPLNDAQAFTILSMGMSDDHQLAIAHGSNMVRIGSSIFGIREY